MMKNTKNKICVITRGAPGAGKSTWIKNNLPSWSVVCSADHYHINEDGEYNWKPQNVKKAHEWCRQCFITALDEAVPIVVVDNTNIRIWEMRPYMELAEQYGYKIRIVRLVCSEDKLLGRNIHGVPDDDVKKMLNNMQEWYDEEIFRTD